MFVENQEAANIAGFMRVYEQKEDLSIKHRLVIFRYSPWVSIDGLIKSSKVLVNLYSGTGLSFSTRIPACSW